jgi:hypothetical protein
VRGDKGTYLERDRNRREADRKGNIQFEEEGLEEEETALAKEGEQKEEPI